MGKFQGVIMPTTPTGSRVTSMPTPERLAREEGEDLAGPGRLADALRQRLALLAAEDAAQLVLARHDLVRGLLEDVVAKLRVALRPGRKRRLRRSNRRLGISRRTAREFTDHVIEVRRIEVRAGMAG
jgi:hypothetical protein